MKTKTTQEPLQVYATRELAEANLTRYASLCVSYGVAHKYRVKAAPMQKGRYSGHWGIWLVRHER